MSDARTPVQVRTGPLPTPEADEVRELAARAAAVDGIAPLSEQPLLWLQDDEARVVHLLARDPDGTLAGYAQLDTSLAATVRGELVVGPDHRRRGVGRALLAAAVPVTDDVADRVLHVWAHGDLPAARAFAADAGMPVVRELWQMRLEPLPGRRDVVLPPGVTLREFVPGQDEDAWRRVNSRAFAHHPEQGRMTSADLRAREQEAWFDPAGFLLAERDGKLLGSVWTKVHPAGEHGPDPVGEIYVVGVDPDAQGLGLGSALTVAGLDHLAARGLSAAILYTGAENTVAVRTYRRAGFERSATDVMFGSDTRRSPSGATMAP
ncbi:mycothiol synthase [Cellulomonas sp. PhB150]|uniref:mycothiol synthase n=1 Tax=Cellulomonas sp. PhB150 TaxID=2485188 RepID=UPI000F48F1BA|nr:mycothiol synthase [Cellulomonas sp. PhB150]ROS31669.1 mycothiol synthase [Cellulomonas sp. PhB150]